MEPLKGDVLFDKFMLFLANRSKPISEEWFKVMEWLIVIAAISFLHHKTNNYVYAVLSIISGILIGLYFLFGYMRAWHHFFYRTKNAIDGEALSYTFKGYLVWATGAIAIMLLSSVVVMTAIMFGIEASKVLHGE